MLEVVVDPWLGILAAYVDRLSGCRMRAPWTFGPKHAGDSRITSPNFRDCLSHEELRLREQVVQSHVRVPIQVAGRIQAAILECVKGSHT